MGMLILVSLMQVDIRPFKLSDAGELQRAVLVSVGHISPWLDWCSPGYSLRDAQMWVAESMALWQQGLAFRWVMLGEDRRKILGSVEVSVPTLEAPVGRMGYWVRRGASGQGDMQSGRRSGLGLGVFVSGFTASRTVYSAGQ